MIFCTVRPQSTCLTMRIYFFRPHPLLIPHVAKIWIFEKSQGFMPEDGDTWMLIHLHLPGDDYESAVPEEKQVRPEM